MSAALVWEIGPGTDVSATMSGEDYEAEKLAELHRRLMRKYGDHRAKRGVGADDGEISVYFDSRESAVAAQEAVEALLEESGYPICRIRAFVTLAEELER